MRRVGNEGGGDCGIIATWCAHHSFFENKLELTAEEWEEPRRLTTEWLRNPKNKKRYESHPASNSAVVAYDELIKGLAREGDGPRNGWVHPEFLWVYAMTHRLNVYMVHVNAVEDEAKKVTRSTFDVQLITPERFFDCIIPIASPSPNTIAIWFHTIRWASKGDDGKQGAVQETGHYEYLIDKEGRSCWRTSDATVSSILQPAHEEAKRVAYLNSYTECWVRSANKRVAQRQHVFKPGELANLMIGNYVRDASSYHANVDGGVRNMVVKVLHKADTVPRRYTVLSHAGVLKERVQQGELREIGQDVDVDLKERQVTLQMMAADKRVGLMQAWEFSLHRRRSRAQPALPSTAVAPAALSTSIPSSNTRQRARTTAALQEGDGDDAAAVGGSVAICKSCTKPITLAFGELAYTCRGSCQSTMHSVDTQCSRSREWIPVVGVGICCSLRCASVFK
jgi:hypothetical protein